MCDTSDQTEQFENDTRIADKRSANPHAENDCLPLGNCSMEKNQQTKHQEERPSIPTALYTCESPNRSDIPRSDSLPTAAVAEKSFPSNATGTTQLPKTTACVGWCIYPWEFLSGRNFQSFSVINESVHLQSACADLQKHLLSVPYLPNTRELCGPGCLTGPTQPLQHTLEPPTALWQPPAQPYSQSCVHPLTPGFLSPWPMPLGSSGIPTRKNNQQQLLTPPDNDSRRRQNKFLLDFDRGHFSPVASSTPSSNKTYSKTKPKLESTFHAGKYLEKPDRNADSLIDEDSGAFKNLQRWAEGLLSNINAPLSAKNLQRTTDNDVQVSKSKIPSRPDSVDSGFESFTARNTPIDTLLHNRDTIQSQRFLDSTQALREHGGCDSSALSEITPSRENSDVFLSKTFSSPKHKRRFCEKEFKRSSAFSLSLNNVCYGGSASAKSGKPKRKRVRTKRRRKSKEHKNQFKSSLTNNNINVFKLSTPATTEYQDWYKRKTTTAKKRERKQSKPRKSPEKSEHGFRGVTLKITTCLEDGGTSLSIRAYFSSRKLRKLCEKKERERILFEYCHRHRYPDPVLPPQQVQRSYQAASNHPTSGKQCASCGTKKTPLWRDAEDGTPLCNACGIRYKKYRIRCVKCCFIPRKEGKVYQHCFNCGGTLKVTSVRPKLW